MRAAIRRRLRHEDPERGSALVAALAVALVCLALGSVVVANAIETSQDSGADRAHTTEVHAAEGAVDAVYAALEAGTPCTWPASGALDSGSAPTGTQTTATVAYFDEHGVALPCAGDAVTGDPTTAVVTATSTGQGADALGGGTTRTVQSKVELTPNMVPGRGAAIFAANSIMTTNGFTLETSLPDTPVDVWVDTGNVNCNSNVKIDGNLIVVNGTTDISNACRITQNLWSSKKLSVHAAQSAGLATVGQDTYVSANATIAGGSKYGRDLIIAGSMDTWGGGPVVSGQLKTGVGTAAIPQYVPVGLPEVLYKPSDWTGFANAGDRRAAYKTWVADNAIANGSTKAERRNPASDQCRIEGPSYDLNGPLLGPTVATVFDTRHCSNTRFENGLTIKLRADMVIFANDFYATGDFKVVSADGQPHNMWIIVPDPDTTPNGVAECGKTVAGSKSGNIKFDSGSLAVSPITFFGYTPCTLETNNTMTFYGQLYGGSVILRNSMTMRYVPIGIPGVSFPTTNPTVSSGYRVDVVYKREIRTP
jgi:Tfp pilus assembly protein PilX